jgi:hypothetical protein
VVSAEPYSYKFQSSEGLRNIKVLFALRLRVSNPELVANSPVSFVLRIHGTQIKEIASFLYEKKIANV